MVGFEVAAPDKLDLVARLLRDLGDKELRRELYAGLNRATKQLRADAKEEAGRRLPQGGGLAKRIAGSRLSTRRSGGRNPGVRIVANPGGRTVKAGSSQLRLMDEGHVRHPVFGNRNVWVTQEVTGGWFSEPMEAGRDEVVREIEDLLDGLAVQIARRIGLAA